MSPGPSPLATLGEFLDRTAFSPDAARRFREHALEILDRHLPPEEEPREPRGRSESTGPLAQGSGRGVEPAASIEHPDLASSILEYVKANSGSSLRQIRRGVRRRTKDVVQAVRDLEAEGLIENRGTDAYGRYHTAQGNAGKRSGNAGNGHAHSKVPEQQENTAQTNLGGLPQAEPAKTAGEATCHTP